MAKIDRRKLTKDLKDKYEVLERKAMKLDILKNAELDRFGEEKDKVEVVLGDDKQEEFLPQVKFQRWNNEVNFSVRLIDDEPKTFDTDADTVKLVGAKREFHLRDVEPSEEYKDGAFKFEYVLNEKPATNKLTFSLQSKGLDFYYQPPLTQEEIDAGAERPENVVGSYAVYHSTKGGPNRTDGKEYKGGKVGHIYRPKLIDAEGKEAWGELHIDKDAGTYEVTIPQEFLDKAVYPIRSNDTFGHDSQGGSSDTFYDDAVYVCSHYQDNYSFPENGTLDSISMYTDADSTANGWLLGLYVNLTFFVTYYPNEGDLLGSTVEGNDFDSGWNTLNADGTVNLTSGDPYGFAFSIEAGGSSTIYYDTAGSYGTSRQNRTYDGSLPSSYNGASATGTRQLSIYATYTPSGGGDLSVDVYDSVSISEDTTVSLQAPTDFNIDVSDDVSLTEDVTASVRGIDLSVKVEGEEIQGVIIY